MNPLTKTQEEQDALMLEGALGNAISFAEAHTSEEVEVGILKKLHQRDLVVEAAMIERVRQYIESKYGKQGKMSGSLHRDVQTEADQMRDDILYFLTGLNQKV